MQSETREYQKVIDYVSQMIADGQLKIGDRLPTERQMAETPHERRCGCWNTSA